MLTMLTQGGGSKILGKLADVILESSLIGHVVPYNLAFNAEQDLKLTNGSKNVYIFKILALHAFTYILYLLFYHLYIFIILSALLVFSVSLTRVASYLLSHFP